MPVGLGGEQLWWSPSNDVAPYTNNLGAQGSIDDAITIGGVATVADTASGGTRAWSFDGVNDAIAGFQSAYYGTLFQSDFSMSGWVYPVAGEGGGYIITKWYSAGNNRQFVFRAKASGGNFVSNVIMYSSGAGTNVQCEGTITMAPGQWHHVAVNYNQTLREVWVNGVLDTVSNSTTNAPITSSGNAKICQGAFGVSSTYTVSSPAEQKSDDTRIFDRLLTQAEVTHLATARGVLGGPGSDGYNAFTSAIYNPRNYNNTRFG